MLRITPPTEDAPGEVWLPLDRETRLALMERARKLACNPLELGAELLKRAVLSPDHHVN